MNKSYLLILVLLAAMLMTACSQDELLSTGSAYGAIGFGGVFVDKATRGSDFSVSTLSAFDVYGYRDATTIFSNEAVSKVGSNWTYTNTQYWTTGKYNFHAIAPANGSGGGWTFTADASKLSVGTIKLDNSASGFNADKDLIYATSSRDNSESVNSGGVALTFRHLLSKVTFKFVNNCYTTNQVIITDVRITNASARGEFDTDSNEWFDLSGTAEYSFLAAGNTLDVTNHFNSSGDMLRTSVYTDIKYLIPYTKEYTVEIQGYVTDDDGNQVRTIEYVGENAHKALIKEDGDDGQMLPGNSYVIIAALTADDLTVSVTKEEPDGEEDTTPIPTPPDIKDIEEAPTDKDLGDGTPSNGTLEGNSDFYLFEYYQGEYDTETGKFAPVYIKDSDTEYGTWEIGSSGYGVERHTYFTVLDKEAGLYYVTVPSLNTFRIHMPNEEYKNLRFGDDLTRVLVVGGAAWGTGYDANATEDDTSKYCLTKGKKYKLYLTDVGKGGSYNYIHVDDGSITTTPMLNVTLVIDINNSYLYVLDAEEDAVYSQPQYHLSWGQKIDVLGGVKLVDAVFHINGEPVVVKAFSNVYEDYNPEDVKQKPTGG
jgi:hypothetical protein